MTWLVELIKPAVANSKSDAGEPLEKRHSPEGRKASENVRTCPIERKDSMWQGRGGPGKG